MRAAWAGLRADLDAVAAQPADGGTWVQLALRWTELATLAPTHRVRPGDHLLGFSARADGRLQDAALTERALALIDQLLAAGHDPVRLLQPARTCSPAGSATRRRASRSTPPPSTCPAEHPEAAQAAGLLRHHAAMLRAQIGNRSPATDEEIAQLAELARAIAGSVQRIVSTRRRSCGCTRSRRRRSHLRRGSSTSARSCGSMGSSSSAGSRTRGSTRSSSSASSRRRGRRRRPISSSRAAWCAASRRSMWRRGCPTADS